MGGFRCKRESSTSNTYLFLSCCLRASFVKCVDGTHNFCRTGTSLKLDFQSGHSCVWQVCDWLNCLDLIMGIFVFKCFSMSFTNVIHVFKDIPGLKLNHLFTLVPFLKLSYLHLHLKLIWCLSSLSLLNWVDILVFTFWAAVEGK